MSNITLILHFKNKSIQTDELDRLARKLSRSSGLNVICLDKEVTLHIIENNNNQEVIDEQPNQ